MAKLFQVACLLLLLSMIYGWHSSFFFNEPFPLMPFDDDWFSPSEIDEMRGDFGEISSLSSSFFNDGNDQMIETKKKLDSISPVCTTIENSPTNKTIEFNNLRKIFRSTNITTCIKELIDNGMKYIYKQVKIIDNQNRTISQSNYYQSFTINAINDTTSSNSTVDQ